MNPEKLSNLTAEQAQEAQLRYSITGRIGTVLEPALEQIGFDYRIGTALIGAMAAKEMFVSQMGIIFSLGETDEESIPLQQKLSNKYTALQGFCVMLFCLISAPCIATIAVTKRETNSWKWAFFQLGGLTTIAYLFTMIVYQVGSFFA